MADLAVPSEQNPSVFEVLATVTHLLLPYGQAQIETADGHVYAIIERTPGPAKLADLKVGDRLRCRVTKTLPRVTWAEFDAPVSCLSQQQLG